MIGHFLIAIASTHRDGLVREAGTTKALQSAVDILPDESVRTLVECLHGKGCDCSALDRDERLIAAGAAVEDRGVVSYAGSGEFAAVKELE